MPGPLSPQCVFLLVPREVLGWPTLVVLALPSLAFWFVGLHLFTGTRGVPVSTWLVLCGLGALSLLSHIGGFTAGIRLHGAAYAWFCSVASGCLVLSTVLVLTSLRRRPSFLVNVLGHWLLIAWASTYAFPLWTQVR